MPLISAENLTLGLKRTILLQFVPHNLSFGSTCVELASVFLPLMSGILLNNLERRFSNKRKTGMSFAGGYV